ncbi:hypothetical protein D3C85_1173560 [compost metagenome]
MVTVDLDENFKLLAMGAAKVGDCSRSCNAVSDNRQGTTSAAQFQRLIELGGGHCYGVENVGDALGKKGLSFLECGNCYALGSSLHLGCYHLLTFGGFYMRP